MVLDSTRYAIERSARVLRGMTFWGKIRNAFSDDPQVCALGVLRIGIWPKNGNTRRCRQFLLNNTYRPKRLTNEKTVAFFTRTHANRFLNQQTARRREPRGQGREQPSTVRIK